MIALATILMLSFWVQADPKPANQLEAIAVSDTEARTRVEIVGQGDPTFTVFRLTNPTRIFVDVSNATMGSIPEETVVRNGILRTVSVTPMTDDQLQIVRFVFELEVDALYNVTASGARIFVDIDNEERLNRSVVIDSDAAREAEMTAQEAKVRADAAERRAQAAERRANETQAALEDAKARAAANARKAEALRAESETLRRSQNERLAQANQRAAEAERRLAAMESEVQVKLSKSQREAEEAFQRADRAETEAAKKVAQSEARARVEESKAMQAAVAAAKRSKQLEKRALTAEQRAQTAESEVMAVKTRLNSLNAKVAAKASADLVKAQKEQARLRAEAELVMAQAKAAQKAAEEKARLYEVRASEATLRAEQADKQAKNIELTKQQLRDSEAASRRLATAATEAEKKAAEAQALLQTKNQELSKLRTQQEADRNAARAEVAQAQQRAQLAEQRAESLAREAESRALRAEEKLKSKLSESEAEIAKAKAKAARNEAELKRAQARAQSATARATEAEERALAAASKTAEMSRRVEASQRKAEALAAKLEGVQSAKALETAESTVALERVAYEKAQLEEQVKKAELEQAKAKARIETLLVEQKSLAARAAQEKAANQAQRAAVSAAEQRAQAAELSSEKARLAQLDASQRAAKLEGELAKVRAEKALLEQDRNSASTAANASALKSASQRIAKLESLLTDQKRSASESNRLVAKKQDELNRANQAALDAQTKLAEAQERARLAELKAESEAQRASTEAQRAQTQAQRAESEAQRAATEAQRAKLAAQRAQAQAQRAQSAEAAAATNRAEADTAKAAAAEAKAEADRARAEAEAARIQASADREKAEKAERERAETQDRLAETEKRAKDAEEKLEDSKTKAETTAAKKPVVSTTLPPPVLATNDIVDVGFSTENGASLVRIETKGTSTWSLRGDGLTTQTLVLSNAQIAPLLERTLDTSDFGGTVNLVSSFQAPNVANEVHVVVTLREAATGTLEQNGNTLVWRFPQIQGAGAGAYSALPPPAWNGQAQAMATQTTQVAPYTGLNQMTSPVENRGPRGKKRYRGRKVNVDIKDGDIHNVLRVLAKTGNVNIVTSDEVSGTVTMHLKLVPWDQALDMVLRTKGLDMVREGDIIRVAPAEMIAQEREAELKKLEVRERLKPLEVKMITVNHANAKELIPRIKSVLSSRGSAEFDTRTNTVIVKDVDDHLDAAEDMVLRLDTQTPQVLIETRIVEVNEVNVKQFGIQWGMDSTFSAATGNPTGLRFPSSIGISGGADDQQTITEGVSSNPNFVVNLPSAAGAGSGGALGLTFGSIDSTFNLNVRLSAMENRGSVKIVSSPKITTLDNKIARISQGVSIPISQVSATGVQTVFFDAVLALEVRPHVTQDGNIYLKLKAENNTPDFQNVAARGDPTILKKEAQTELLLRDGDTTVIGGIYTSNAGVNSSEVPFFGSIPILGALFRNHQQSDRRTELLIFVTPRIVNRAASTVRTVR